MDYGAQGLGLRVTKALGQGDLVISVPQKAMMTTDTAKASSIGSLIERDPLLQVCWCWCPGALVTSGVQISWCPGVPVS